MNRHYWAAVARVYGAFGLALLALPTALVMATEVTW